MDARSFFCICVKFSREMWPTMLTVATLAVILPLLPIATLTEDPPPITDADLATRKKYWRHRDDDNHLVNATLEAAIAKLSSDYFFLDDPSPGDYFDNIAMATKLFAKSVRALQKCHFDFSWQATFALCRADGTTNENRSRVSSKKCRPTWTTRQHRSANANAIFFQNNSDHAG